MRKIKTKIYLPTALTENMDKHYIPVLQDLRKAIYSDRMLCSCPLISRQGLYLKLTLPADVDILAESDNPTHYADGFHCNARSPLQGYAMPFLHSVSA